MQPHGVFLQEGNIVSLAVLEATFVSSNRQYFTPDNWGCLIECMVRNFPGYTQELAEDATDQGLELLKCKAAADLNSPYAQQRGLIVPTEGFFSPYHKGQDDGWHNLMLHSRPYFEVCETLAGRGKYIHHQPFNSKFWPKGGAKRTVVAMRTLGLRLHEDLAGLAVDGDCNPTCSDDGCQ